MNTLALMSESLTLLSTLQQTVATAKQTIAAVIDTSNATGHCNRPMSRRWS